MEELESMLVSVKAWASKILEALGLCRKDCAALEAMVAEKQAAIDRLLIELSELSKRPQPEPEEKPFDLGPVLAMVGEFKQAIVEVQSRIDALSAKVSAVDGKVGTLSSFVPVAESLRSQLQAVLNRPNPDLASFINKVNVDLDFFRAKLNRLPF